MSKSYRAAKPKAEYFETDSGSRISGKAAVIGAKNIVLGGKTIIQADCILRGDLFRVRTESTGHSSASITTGRYCFFSSETVIRPPCRPHKEAVSYYPMKLGEHVYVGKGAVVEAASIGSYVRIGENCVIGKFAIIKDYVEIEDNSVVPASAVIAPFSRVRGKPGLVVEELSENAQRRLSLLQVYQDFKMV